MTVITYPLSVSGTTTRVVECGSEGPPVLFIHGVMARADRWMANLAPISSDGYHCYAFDLPGHGFASKGHNVAAGVPAYADFVKSFMEGIGVEHAHIVGTSMGGHVAGYFAVNNPDMVDALILVDTVGVLPFGKEAGERTRATVTNMAREGIEARLKMGFVNQELITKEFVDEEFKINNSSGAAESYHRLGEYFYNQIDDDVIGEALASYSENKPVLLIWGEDDKAVPISVGEQSQEKIGHTDLVTIPNAAHFPYIEDPNMFNRIVVEFLGTSDVN